MTTVTVPPDVDDVTRHYLVQHIARDQLLKIGDEVLKIAEGAGDVSSEALRALGGRLAACAETIEAA